MDPTQAYLTQLSNSAPYQQFRPAPPSYIQLVPKLLHSIAAGKVSDDTAAQAILAPMFAEPVAVALSSVPDANSRIAPSPLLSTILNEARRSGVTAMDGAATPATKFALSVVEDVQKQQLATSLRQRSKEDDDDDEDDRFLLQSKSTDRSVGPRCSFFTPNRADPSAPSNCLVAKRLQKAIDDCVKPNIKQWRSAVKNSTDDAATVAENGQFICQVILSETAAIRDAVPSAAPSASKVLPNDVPFGSLPQIREDSLPGMSAELLRKHFPDFVGKTVLDYPPPPIMTGVAQVPCFRKHVEQKGSCEGTEAASSWAPPSLLQRCGELLGVTGTGSLVGTKPTNSSSPATNSFRMDERNTGTTLSLRRKNRKPTADLEEQEAERLEQELFERRQKIRREAEEATRLQEQAVLEQRLPPNQRHVIKLAPSGSLTVETVTLKKRGAAQREPNLNEETYEGEIAAENKKKGRKNTRKNNVDPDDALENDDDEDDNDRETPAPRPKRANQRNSKRGRPESKKGAVDAMDSDRAISPAAALHSRPQSRYAAESSSVCIGSHIPPMLQTALSKLPSVALRAALIAFEQNVPPNK